MRIFIRSVYSRREPKKCARPVPIEMPQEPTHEAAPSMEEVRAAVMSLKNRKAAGVDNVTAEAIKAGGEVLVQRLHRLMCRVWQTEVVPTTWKRSIIVPIHKKGDITECKNYRGISLLSVVGKVFTKIINARLQLHRRSLCRPEQAGFCPGRGCSDQIFALRQLLEERIRCGKRVVVVFIDLISLLEDQ
ncbi:hypothetical protein OSTOST_18884 [Ostertagia ostertagi]